MKTLKKIIFAVAMTASFSSTYSMEEPPARATHDQSEIQKQELEGLSEAHNIDYENEQEKIRQRKELQISEYTKQICKEYGFFKDDITIGDLQPFVDNGIPFKNVINLFDKEPILHHFASNANYAAVEFIVANTPKEDLLNLFINENSPHFLCNPILNILAQDHAKCYVNPKKTEECENIIKITKFLLSSLPSDADRIDFITKQKNLEGETALHTACIRWNYDFAELLLSQINTPSDRITFIKQKAKNNFSALSAINVCSIWYGRNNSQIRISQLIRLIDLLLRNCSESQENRKALIKESFSEALISGRPGEENGFFRELELEFKTQLSKYLQFPEENSPIGLRLKLKIKTNALQKNFDKYKQLRDQRVRTLKRISTISTDLKSLSNLKSELELGLE